MGLFSRKYEGMRRADIKDALGPALDRHFPEDVARQFDRSKLDGIAEHVQNMFEPRDAAEVDSIIEAVRRENITDADLDKLADGEISDPIEWLDWRIN